MLVRAMASLEYRISSQSFRAFESGKRAFHTTIGTRPAGTIFIFGCQRSGTTHLEKLFRSDPRSVVYGEFSALSIHASKTVWPSLCEVRRRIETSPGRYVVVRSLLSSHLAINALDAVPSSRAVWMYRNVEEVVSSMLRKWSGDFEAVSRRVESDEEGRWELEELWRDLHLRLADMSVAAAGSIGRQRDLYALYWHSRNEIYFEKGLHTDARVKLLDYRSLLKAPEASKRALTSAIGLVPAAASFPLRTARLSPVVRRQDFLSPEIGAICEDLLLRLRSAEASRQ